MKRLCLSLALVIVATLLIAVPALAAYYVYIIAENTGTDYTMLALNMTLDVEGLVDGGYISSTGLDTRVTDSGYNVLPHMLADDRVMWVSDLPGDTSTQFIFWIEQSDMDSFPTIAGHGGYVTINDDPDLEPGDVYAFAVVAYVDTATGPNKNIIRKDNACKLYVSGTDAITFTVAGGNSLVASNVSSGLITIMVYCDSFEMWMTIGDVEKDRNSASTVSNTTSDWYLFENDVCPYVLYYGAWVVPQ